MKPLYIWFVLILLPLLSCTQRAMEESEQTDSTAQQTSQRELTPEERRAEIAESDRIDSLRLLKVLNAAVDIATSALDSNYFYTQYEAVPDDSSFIVNVNVMLGYLFSDTARHLLVRRIVPWGTFLDVYQIHSRTFTSVISREQGMMSYVGDTIRDVNGDKQRDFLVHWYPSSGCCRRNIYNVYLYQPEKGSFTSDYEFINPTFLPEEKVIRGVEYGHPGEVGLYKYKWNGLQVDTVEFIYPDRSDTTIRSYIRTTQPLYSSDSVRQERLRNMPKEYLSIESYEWFDWY